MADPNIGFATLSVIPSVQGIQGQLSRQLGSPLTNASRDAGGRAGGGFLGGFKTVAKAGAAAAGVAVAAVVVKGFSQAIDQELTSDRIAASFGLDPAEQERLGGIAGDLYADAYGDSFGEVNEAVIGVQRQLGALGTDEIESLSENALDFAAVFDRDVNESISAAQFLIRNGLAKDGEEAFDLLTSTLQQVAPTVRDEVLEATQEYSTFFGDLGVSGEEAFGLIADAAETSGKFGVDKTGDALKELSIRATDMSTASVAAYEAAGLNAEEMADRFLEGGDTARGALDELVEGLLGMDDPVARSNAAIGLFGTPLEDLSASEIPDFLGRLTDMGDGMGDVAGSADDLGEANDNAATRIEAFKRGAMQELSEFIGDTVLPALSDFSDFFEENIQPVLADLGDFINAEVVPALGEFFTGVDEDLRPALEDLWDTIEADLLPVLEELWQVFANDILPIYEEVYGFLFRNFLPILGEIISITAEVVTKTLEDWERFKENFATVVDTVSTVYTDVTGFLDDLVDFVTGLPGRITGAVSGMWDGISEGFLTVINHVISIWNGLEFTLPSGDVFGVEIGGQTLGVPDIPLIGTGGTGRPAPPHIAFHDGGVADFGGPGREGLALLLDGERVLSPQESAAYERSGGIGGPDTIQLVLDRRVLGEVVRDEDGYYQRRN